MIYPPKISKNGDLPEQHVSLPEGKPDEWGKIHNVHGIPIPSGLRCRSPAPTLPLTEAKIVIQVVAELLEKCGDRNYFKARVTIWL